MNLTLLLIWLVFTVLFFILGRWHFEQSRHTIPPFKVTQRKFEQPDSDVHIIAMDLAGTPLDQPLKDFVYDFNNYLENQNKSNRKMNQLAACGYFLAALTALVSMVLVIASLRSQ